MNHHREHMTGEWFNPWTGQRSAAGTFGNGTVTLTPPENANNALIVLHIKVR